MLNNSLITKQGKVLEMVGVNHDAFCESQLHIGLDKFLNGGVRIKINGENMAIEAVKPLTKSQISVVNQLLRDNEIFYLVTSIAGQVKTRQEFRHIKVLR